MNIIEAVKSGKRFWRKSQGNKCFFEEAQQGSPIASYFRAFTKDDILATDWEVEEKKVEISREQLEKTMKCHVSDGFIERVAKELGL